MKEGKLDKKYFHGIHTDYLNKNEETVSKSKFTGSLGPLRAPSNIRVTCRFDFDPSRCKDYHDTGYCVFGGILYYLFNYLGLLS